MDPLDRRGRPHHPKGDAGKMKEHPIIFSAEMVRAILDGRKTQTRRIVKPQPVALPEIELEAGDVILEDGTPHKIVAPAKNSGNAAAGRLYRKRLRCPYGQPGDRLWVRESWWECTDNNDSPKYVADGPPPTTDRRQYRKRPSIHMPRWASRITLKVKAVRVERVQEIRREDALAEGVSGGCGPNYDFALFGFKRLWDSINAKRGFGWDVNPWVWVIEFEPLDSP